MSTTDTTHYIYVTLDTTDSSGSTLNLSDDENHSGHQIDTAVHPGDTVYWQLGANSGITSLDGISNKVNPPNDPTSVNVFSSIVQESPNVWKGIVSGSDGQHESYNISYTVGTTSHTYDPKISVNT